MIPKWPEVALIRHAPDYVTIETDTSRPRTPIFAIKLKGDGVPFYSDKELLAIGKASMQKAYAAAHPNGCP